MGLSALQEFALRGKGTPFPLDPPLKLVTTGPYAYVSNPMQTAQILLYCSLAMFLGNAAFYVAGTHDLDILQILRQMGGNEGLLERFGKTMGTV